MIPMSMLVATTFPLLFRFLSRSIGFDIFKDPYLLVAILGGSSAYIWAIYENIYRRQMKAPRGDERELEGLRQESKDLDVQIEKYTTLYVTERKKLLF